MLFLGVGLVGAGCVFMGWFCAWTSLRHAYEHYRTPSPREIWLGKKRREPFAGLLWRAMTGQPPMIMTTPPFIKRSHGVSLLIGLVGLLAGVMCLFLVDWRAGAVGIGGAVLGTWLVSVLWLVWSALH